jgi:hypothetical protein
MNATEKKNVEVILYKRYANKDNKEKIEKVRKLTRAQWMVKLMQEEKYESYTDFIVDCTEMYEGHELNEESRTWETNRIWKILVPALIDCDINVPQILR